MPRNYSDPQGTRLPDKGDIEVGAAHGDGAYHNGMAIFTSRRAA